MGRTEGTGDNRDYAKSRMDYAEVNHVLESGFWMEYKRQVRRMLELAQVAVNDSIEPVKIYRGQGKIEAYKKLSSLEEDVKKILKGKAGSSE